MRKIVISFTLLLALIGLAGCNEASAQSVLKTEKDILNYSMVSLANLVDLNANTTTEIVSYSETNPDMIPDDVPTETEVEADLVLEKYLSLIETYLSNGTLDVQMTVSDREAYAQMITYSTKDMLGETRTYVIYYNELILVEPIEETNDETEPETTPDTDTTTNESEIYEPKARRHEYDDDFEDEFDSEVVTELTGLIVINDKEFELVGRKVVEDDETTYKFLAYVDKDNFIKIMYESEEDDQKLRFKQVENGLLVFESKIKIETEDQMTIVKLDYSDGVTSSKYMFKQSTDASYDIMVKYEIRESNRKTDSGQIKININVDPETGETTYEYTLLGTSKGHKHEHKDEFERHNQGKSSNGKR